MKNICCRCFFVLSVPLFNGCVPIPYSSTDYHDDKVTVTNRGVTWLVHGGFDYDVITVYGHTYSNARGAGSCYLEIPGKNALLFVTGGEGKAVVHIVDMTTHVETNFPAYDSNIGNLIRPASEDGKFEFEKVESVIGDLLIISSAQIFEKALISRHYKQFIDLKASKFIRQEFDYYDDWDKKWHHDIYEGGKTPPHTPVSFVERAPGATNSIPPRPAIVDHQ